LLLTKSWIIVLTVLWQVDII